MLRWIKALLGLERSTRTPLLELDTESLELMRERLKPLRKLSVGDAYETLDEETRQRVRSRQAAADAARAPKP